MQWPCPGLFRPFGYNSPHYRTVRTGRKQPLSLPRASPFGLAAVDAIVCRVTNSESPDSTNSMFFGSTWITSGTCSGQYGTSPFAENRQRDTLFTDDEMSDERRIVSENESLELGDQWCCAVVPIQRDREVAIGESAHT